MTSELLRSLLALTLASSGAVLLALVVRRPIQHLLGAATACAMWLSIPAAMLAVLLPHMRSAASGFLPASPPVSVVGSVLQGSLVLLPGAADSLAWAAYAWMAGAVVLVCCVIGLQRAFVKSLGRLSGSGRVLHAEGTAGCPAVMGILRPKLILPADFRLRYTRLERRLILAHERAHLRRGDTVWNALAALLSCVFWFNPLSYLAAACFRVDQELACDAAVMQRYPSSRRTYAAAMLKTQLADVTAPAGCSWSSVAHLRARLRMLGRALPGHARQAWGRIIVALTCMAAGYTAWAAQPAAPPEAAAAGTAKTAAASPDDPGVVAIHPITLEVDDQELQFLAGPVEYYADTVYMPNASGDGDFQGNVHIRFHIWPAQSATIPGRASEGANEQWTGDLLLQADAARVEGFRRVATPVTFADGCVVTLRDRSGKALWAITGTKCSLHARRVAGAVSH
jgi:beta-lactamase regulating signal transducer with metallopeptidase domain